MTEREELMDSEETVASEASTPRKRKTAARKPAARRTTRKTAPRRKAARRRSASRTSFEGVIKSITGSVAVARAAIAEASGQGATAMRRVVGNASTASRKSITRLAREWKAMDPRKKARILAALLGAAAVASAPLVRSRWKKR